MSSCINSISNPDMKFSRTVLQDENKFKQFLSGKNQIEKIINDCLDKNLDLSNNFSTIRKVIGFVTIPLNIIGCIFFEIASKVLFFSKLSIRCKIIERHFEFNIDYYLNNYKYKNKLISSSVNGPDLNVSDIYLQNAFKTDEFNPKIAKRINFNELNQIDFSGVDGVCFGMSNWFIYLFLKTQKKCPDIEKHLKVVGKIFENGANHQALILQPMQKDLHKSFRLQLLEAFKASLKTQQCKSLKDNILKICDKLKNVLDKLFEHVKKLNVSSDFDCIVNQHKLIFKYPMPDLSGTFQDFINSTIEINKNLFKDKLRNKINLLPNGAYLISASDKRGSHIISFIKDNEKKYIFDSNIGVIKIEDIHDLDNYFDDTFGTKFEKVVIYKSSLND